MFAEGWEHGFGALRWFPSSAWPGAGLHSGNPLCWCLDRTWNQTGRWISRSLVGRRAEVEENHWTSSGTQKRFYNIEDLLDYQLEVKRSKVKVTTSLARFIQDELLRLENIKLCILIRYLFIGLLSPGLIVLIDNSFFFKSLDMKLLDLHETWNVGV